MGVDFYMAENPMDRWLAEYPHHDFIDWLQFHILEWHSWRSAGVKRRKKLLAILPRFSGKTFMCTRTTNLWFPLLDRDLSLFIGSETHRKAMEWFAPIPEILKGGGGTYPWFSWLYGTWYDKDRAWEKAKIVHAYRLNTAIPQPSYGTWGVEGGIVGYHPDGGWLDDPLSESKIAESGTWIETVVRAVAQLTPAFRTDSIFGMALTRKADNDVAGKVIEKEGIKSWTGHPSNDIRYKVKPTGQWDIYHLQARDPETRQSILPQWTTQALDDYEGSDPSGFAGEMMNTPGTGEHMPLDIDDVEKLWVNLDEIPERMTVTFHFDTSFKNAKRIQEGDWNVITVGGHDPTGNGTVYFLEGVGSKRWDVNEFLRQLIILIQKYQAAGHRIYGMTDEQETGGKTGAWKALLTNYFHGHGIPLPRLFYQKRGSKAKIARIVDAAAFWADGHVKLVRGATNVELLVDQMLRIGKSSHDDWADAFSDVFADEIYRPMKLLKGAPKKNMPYRPGDEYLKSGYNPKTADETRDLYDFQTNKLDKDPSEPDSWPY